MKEIKNKVTLAGLLDMVDAAKEIQGWNLPDDEIFVLWKEGSIAVVSKDYVDDWENKE